MQMRHGISVVRHSAEASVSETSAMLLVMVGLSAAGQPQVTWITTMWANGNCCAFRTYRPLPTARHMGQTTRLSGRSTDRARSSLMVSSLDPVSSMVSLLVAELEDRGRPRARLARRRRRWLQHPANRPARGRSVQWSESFGE